MNYFTFTLALLNLSCGVLCGWLAVATERRRRSNTVWSAVNLMAAAFGAYQLLSAS